MTVYKPKQEVKINNWLLFGLIASIIVIIILVVSRWFVINTWVFICAAFVIVVYMILQYLKSKKSKFDVFSAALQIQYRKEEAKIPGTKLNVTLQNIMAWPIDPNKYLIFFKAENIGFIWEKGVIIGVDNRSFVGIIDYINKSDLFKNVIQTQIQNDLIKQRAKELGLEEVGIGQEEEDEEDDE